MIHRLSIPCRGLAILTILAVCGCARANDPIDAVMDVVERFTGPAIPDDQRLALRGVTIRADGDPHTAEVLLEAALTENPGNAMALLELGQLYRDTGRDEHAMAMFTRVVALGQADQGSVDPSLVDRARELMVATQRARVPPPDWSLVPRNPDLAVVSRFQTLMKLREEGLIGASEYEMRRKANLGALLPLTAPPPDVAVVRQAVPAGDVISRLRTIERFRRENGLTSDQYTAERAAVLDALMPLHAVEPAPIPFPPKNDIEARLYLDRLDRLSKVGLISEPEARGESDAIVGVFTPSEAKKMRAKNMAADESMKMAPADRDSASITKEKVARPPDKPMADMAAKMAPASEPAIDGALGIHVGSYRTPQRALRSWTEIRDAVGDLVADLRPRIVRTPMSDPTGPALFQLRLGPLADAAAITSLCDALRGRGLYCAPTTL